MSFASVGVINGLLYALASSAVAVWAMYDLGQEVKRVTGRRRYPPKQLVAVVLTVVLFVSSTLKVLDDAKAQQQLSDQVAAIARQRIAEAEGTGVAEVARAVRDARALLKIATEMRPALYGTSRVDTVIRVAAPALIPPPLLEQAVVSDTAFWPTSCQALPGDSIRIDTLAGGGFNPAPSIRRMERDSSFHRAICIFGLGDTVAIGRKRIPFVVAADQKITDGYYRGRIQIVFNGFRSFIRPDTTGEINIQEDECVVVYLRLDEPAGYRFAVSCGNPAWHIIEDR